VEWLKVCDVSTVTKSIDYRETFAPSNIDVWLLLMYGPGWVAHVWKSLFQSTSDIMDVYATWRK